MNGKDRAAALARLLDGGRPVDPAAILVLISEVVDAMSSQARATTYSFYRDAEKFEEAQETALKRILALYNKIDEMLSVSGDRDAA